MNAIVPLIGGLLAVYLFCKPKKTSGIGRATPQDDPYAEIAALAQGFVDYMYNEGVIDFDDEHLELYVSRELKPDFRDIARGILYDFKPSGKVDKILNEYARTGSPLMVEVALMAGIGRFYSDSISGHCGAIGKLSDDPLELKNILMGVERGWYTARVEELAGFGYVVYLAGKKADGEYTEDVYPISKETAEALMAQGVGRAPKRRIFEEVADAQRNGISLFDKYDGSKESVLIQLAQKYGYKGSQRSTKPYAEQYFNSLYRAYNAIAGTTLPYKESVVYNDLGDEVMRYRNYGTDEQKFRAALDELTEGYGEQGVYWRILGMLASGDLKFLWTLPDKQLQMGNRGLQEELYGRKAPQERKLYRKLLATKEKGGVTPAKAAEQLYSYLGDKSGLTDLDMRNIILDVLHDIQTPEQARDMIMDAYYDMHREAEPEYFTDDPEQANLYGELQPEYEDPDLPF